MNKRSHLPKIPQLQRGVLAPGGLAAPLFGLLFALLYDEGGVRCNSKAGFVVYFGLAFGLSV